MSTTTYLELDDQATGANNNTWGDVADANMGFIELAIARSLGVSTTGGTTTLTTAQNRYPLIRVTGVLVSNATIVVRTAEKHFVVKNDTTGAYSVTVKTTAGTGKTIPRGRACHVYCDGTNVELARHQSIPHAAAGGTVDAITATFEPAWVAAEIQDGTMWIVEAAGANTSTTPNFTPDGGSTYTIKKFGAQALALGDIRAAGHKLILMYDASGGHVELLNPANASIFQTKGADLASAGTVTVLDDGDYVHITGTTTITDLDFTTARNGKSIKVVFDGILTLTHHSTTFVLPTGANITTAAGDTAEFVQDSSDNIKCLWYQRASGASLAASATTDYPPGLIYGLTMSNAADTVNDITVAAGKARDEADTGNLVLSASITKRIDAAWAVGDAQGGLNTGAVANDTWYEVHLIKRVDTGVVDVMFTTTANRATLPTNYTLQRRIGWIRYGTATLLQFTQVDDHFTWTTQINTTFSGSAAATAATLTVPPNSIARFRASLQITAGSSGDKWTVVFSEIAEGNVSPATSTAIASLHVVKATNDTDDVGHFDLRVSSTSTIEHDSTGSGSAAATVDISTFGFIDTRLRLGP